jgi:hypothetical protein
MFSLLVYAIQQNNMVINSKQYNDMICFFLDTTHSRKTASAFISLYTRYRMDDPLNLKDLFAICYKYECFQEADVLWRYASEWKIESKKIPKVMIPLETCMAFLKILLAQKREHEALNVFRWYLGTLPSKNRRGAPFRESKKYTKIHDDFIALCEVYGCKIARDSHIDTLKDLQIFICN